MVRVKLTMNPTQQILLKRGLNKNGDAQRFFTHEPVVGVVADNIDPHFFHQAVKAHGRGALEGGVRVSGAAHTDRKSVV